MFVEQAKDGVLEEKEVKSWNLPNLRNVNASMGAPYVHCVRKWCCIRTGAT